ncbi:MAG: glucose-6-phosphate isomerase [Bacteroidales bacterium]|nr:glucose-6-phosphate isomerase [Bacteroidales bacterium]MBQ5541278.1 glucose-6-phosphate isomerase [Bacteroidales bacterium]
MKDLKLDISKAFGFVSENDYKALQDKALQSNAALYDKTLPGNDFLGWVDVRNIISLGELLEIEKKAAELREKIEVLVVIGIGGSYLGAKAVIEALSNSFAQMNYKKGKPLVLFAGQNIGEDYISELMDAIADKSYALCVISKSGTTTEPAIAFRLLKAKIEEKYGKKEAADRIVAITDKSRGALRTLADSEGYKTFVIGDTVGGRFSVLTPVGLFPIAVAGFDIRQLLEGALSIEEKTNKENSFDKNISAHYAVVRNLLYNKKFSTEILVNFHPKLHYFSEWWKQLYGESEGKDGKGIFPASVDFTSDLHSMGQYIQEGVRLMYETVLSVAEPDKKVEIPSDAQNLDQLNFLAGKRVDFVNKQAELGTQLAHLDGGVPQIRIEIPKLNEYYLGQLIYFFEKACGISGYILGVNPFNQPGVEAYKKNMFALLDKPGYEEASKAIRQRLA